MWANSVFSMEESRSYVAPRIVASTAGYFPTYGYKSSAPVVSPKANRVIAFRSSASWKSYFQTSKATNKLIVVYFTASWCGPCRKMEPAIDEFAAKYSDVEFAKIDVDKLFDVSCEYGVQTMPTFLLMRKGNVIDKVTGARKDDLQRKIEKYRV